MGGHFFPRVSVIEGAMRFNFEINKILRFILLFVTPAIAFLFLLRKLVVLLVFSEEFMGSIALFPIYLFGSFFFLVGYIFSATLLARKKLKMYSIVNLGQNLLYVLLFTILLNKSGLMAIPIAYLVANVLTVAINVIYQLRMMKIKITIDNIRLFVFSIIFICIVFFVPQRTLVVYISKYFLFLAWLIFMTGKKEKVIFFTT